MISVGCDFGLRKSGIVLLDDRFEIVSQNFLQVSDKIRGAERLVTIEKGFDSIIAPYRNETIEVFVEGYAYGAKYQRESLAELGGVMRRYLYLNKYTFWTIPPTSLKAFVTGTSKANKNYMKKCTKENWSLAFKSDDVCDAYGLSRLGMCVMKALHGVQGYAHLEQHQQSVIKDIILHPEQHRNSSTAKKRTRKK